MLCPHHGQYGRAKLNTGWAETRTGEEHTNYHRACKLIYEQGFSTHTNTHMKNPVPAARTASLPPADQLLGLGLGKRGPETRPGQMLPVAKKTTSSPPPTSPYTQSTTPPPTPSPSYTNESPAWRPAEAPRDSTSASDCASSSQTYPESTRSYKSKPNRPKDPKPEVNAVIVSWLRTRFSAEDSQSFNTFIHSKGKSLPVQDLLRGYRYAAKLIAQYNDTRTPGDLEGAPDRKISKVSCIHCMRAL